jgi:hypothetical protein
VKRLAAPLLGVAIFLLNVWLNAPLFMPGELPFRGSIEGGYVAMARLLSRHPDPWGWNPLVYCGLPTQFSYVPALPYTAALFIRLFPHASPDTVYRILVSLLTCAGPVTLFIFALHFTGSRWWSFAAAVAYSFLSPSYGLFPAIEKDRGLVQLPWRIQVLAKYGEGPHDTGLTLLPLALLAAWRAGSKRSYPRIFAASVLVAAIPLINWVAALALAICCLLLLAATWREPWFETWRVFAAAALAWLLACFWLTPTFIKTIAFNWPVDSFAYQLGSQQVLLLAAMVLGVVLIRLFFLWRRGSFYFCLTVMGAFVFGLVSTAYYVYGIDTLPESRRYAIEFEFFLALALAEALRLAMRSANSTVRLCAIGTGGMLLLAGAPQVWSYVSQGWTPWLPVPPESTVEYRIAQWLAGQHPEGRIFASGGLRFRLNSWFDLPQVGGEFETGLQNRAPVSLAYGVRSGQAHQNTIEAMQSLGVQYIVVHGPKSREYYRDFVHPERLAALPVAWHTEDDTVYALPPPAVPLTWTDPNSFTVASTGRPITVQVNNTPGWHATQAGREIAITSDGLGFMVLHPAAPGQIDLRYHGTLEQRLMAALSALSWIGAVGLLVRHRRMARALWAAHPGRLMVKKNIVRY